MNMKTCLIKAKYHKFQIKLKNIFKKKVNLHLQNRTIRKINKKWIIICTKILIRCLCRPLQSSIFLR
jgi:hypothetical protein